MKVRIQAFITARDGSYAYYPGQVIHDHEHAAEWVGRGQAVEIKTPAHDHAGNQLPLAAVLPAGDTAEQAVGETPQTEKAQTGDMPKPKRSRK